MSANGANVLRQTEIHVIELPSDYCGISVMNNIYSFSSILLAILISHVH